MAKVKRKKRRAQAPPIAKSSVPTAESAEVEPQAEEPKARTSGQFQDVDAVIDRDMIAYHFWREWWKAKGRGDFDFIFELSAEGSSLRVAFGPRDEFSETCRRKLRPVPGLVEGELRRIRLHGDDEAYLINAVGLSTRERRSYTAERWFMLRGDAGWRVHQIDDITVSKEREPGDLTLADFPDVVFPDGITPGG